MKRLRSHVMGNWHEADAGFTPLVNPSTEETIAEASSAGIDFAGTLRFARERGGPALRELSFTERSEILLRISKALHARREELIELSIAASGATRKDAKFDLDGATGTLSYYAQLGHDLGAGYVLPDGEGVQLTRSARFWGRHVFVSRLGVAVHVNAFNFPAWGFAEKAACALLAGMPVITKPATSTAAITERCVEILVEEKLLPSGALSLICGSTGDLLKLLGVEDVLAFTGSAATARELRGLPNLLAAGTRVNVEADSLNAAILAADVEPESETWDVFLRDVTREITQKSGQKCTAVRRIFVPHELIDRAEEALRDRLEQVVVGNPTDPKVTMGPLATRRQLDDAIAGIAKLAGQARIVLGAGKRIDGFGSDPGKGYFLAPTLLRADQPQTAEDVHRHEVFGPVSTVMPYDGTPRQAMDFTGMARGSLVTSIYSDELDFLEKCLLNGAGLSGRLYLGSRKVAEQLPGSGIVLPQLTHGGPGHAGGGEELGGLRGVHLYMRRLALSGDRSLLERMVEEAEAE